MANKSPSFQFYPSDWVTGAPATMSPDETHVLVWMMCREWDKVGFVDDPADNASWCRLSRKRFDKAWLKVRQSFVERDDKLYHPRLDKERAKQAEWREKSAKGGHRSAEARKHHTDNGGSRVVEPDHQPTGNTSVSVSGFQSLVTTPSTTASGRAMLLELLPPSRRQATAATLDMWAQGYDLPQGIGIPTTEQIDAACREAAASREIGTLGVGTLRNFLVRVMQGPGEPFTQASPRRKVAGSFLEVE